MQPELPHILTPAQARHERDYLHSQGKKLVFTNGCFDILHRGHTQYLAFARAQGDALVVGLNSDASVRRAKGPTRPVNAEQDRAFVLGSLRAVDFVVIFDEDEPRDLISQILPDVLVKEKTGPTMSAAATSSKPMAAKLSSPTWSKANPPPLPSSAFALDQSFQNITAVMMSPMIAISRRTAFCGSLWE